MKTDLFTSPRQTDGFSSVEIAFVDSDLGASSNYTTSQVHFGKGIVGNAIFCWAKTIPLSPCLSGAKHMQIEGHTYDYILSKSYKLHLRKTNLLIFLHVLTDSP